MSWETLNFLILFFKIVFPYKQIEYSPYAYVTFGKDRLSSVTFCQDEIAKVIQSLNSSKAYD